jgi:poly(A) polymerase
MHPRSPLAPAPAASSESSEPHEPRPRGLALDPPEPEPAHAPEIPPDRLDPEALRVIYRLRHMRHQAYLVGGCVRDLLLGRTPKDFDVATDAHPGEVRATFRNCRLIGRRFRLAHVYFRGGKVIEVATFRKNPVDVGEDVPDAGDLLITRDNVFGTAEEDAVRRDFTVNGLFYDPGRGEVIDYVGGRADLEAHRISTIGDPEVRMREDPVRALRAVRFAARLGFTIAPDTFAAMRRHAGELGRCAPARVLEELFKLLRCGASARAVELLRAIGALPHVLPPLAAALDGWDEAGRRAFFSRLGALDRMVRRGEEVSEAVLLGALLVHLGDGEAESGPEAEALLSGLVSTARLPRRIAERVRLALAAQRTLQEPARRRRRRGRGAAGQAHFQDALQLLALTVEATGEGKERLERWREEMERGRGRGEAAPAERAEEESAERPGPAAEERAAEGEGAPPAEGAGEGAGAPPARRRRRRRGGRRRRRRGTEATA